MRTEKSFETYQTQYPCKWAGSGHKTINKYTLARAHITCTTRAIFQLINFVHSYNCYYVVPTIISVLKVTDFTGFPLIPLVATLGALIAYEDLQPMN